MAVPFAGMTDRVFGRWEQMAPREKRLVSLLGLTFVLCIFGFIGFQIQEGLKNLETRNARTRAALASIDQHRDELSAGKVRGADPDVLATTIGDEPVSLATYLEKIANDVGLSLPETTESTKPSKTGKFQEHTIDVTLRNITIDQLAMFLKRVETDQPGVVTQHLNVKPYRSDHVHMDVELTIATFEKNKAKKDDSKGSKEKAKDADKGAGG